MHPKAGKGGAWEAPRGDGGPPGVSGAAGRSGSTESGSYRFPKGCQSSNVSRSYLWSIRSSLNRYYFRNSNPPSEDDPGPRPQSVAGRVGCGAGAEWGAGPSALVPLRRPAPPARHRGVHTHVQPLREELHAEPRREGVPRLRLRDAAHHVDAPPGAVAETDGESWGLVTPRAARGPTPAGPVTSRGSDVRTGGG